MKLKSNEPFWLVKNGLLNTYPSLETDLKTDILIVGGGITGSLIAAQCVRDGYDTVLIEVPPRQLPCCSMKLIRNFTS
jgi:heterodisulfide reductase subunit A-like polyferredoxin